MSGENPQNWRPATNHGFDAHHSHIKLLRSLLLLPSATDFRHEKDKFQGVYFLGETGNKHHNYVRQAISLSFYRKVKTYVSGKLRTYPSPKLILTLCSQLGQNVGLSEG